MPAWADSLFEDETPWDTTLSVTHFIDLMSHGKYTIRGDVYGSVVSLDKTIEQYVTDYPSTFDTIKFANVDVARKVVADLDSTITKYDSDGDTFFDWMYVVYWSGISATVDTSTGSPYNITNWAFTGLATFARDPTFVPFPSDSTRGINFGRNSGAAQAPSRTGSGEQVRTRRSVAAVATHELGHDLFASGGHFENMSVYAIMDGFGSPGTYFCARELEVLGWISPTIIGASTTGGSTTVVLPAVPDSNGYVRVDTQDPAQSFYLELRNRDLPYAQGPQGPGGCQSHIRSHVGLLISHRHCSSVAGKCLFPEVATGKVNRFGDPDPVWGVDAIEDHLRGSFHDADSDLYQEGHVNVFSSYTNPSTDLYGPWQSNPGDPGLYGYPQNVYSGVTFYDIEWVNPGSDDSIRVSIRFDTLADSTADADTIRVNTKWDGLVQLTGDVVVDSAVTLTVTENADVLSGPIDVNASGADTALVELIVVGALDAEGESLDPAVFSSARDSTFEHYIPSLSVPLLDLPVLPDTVSGPIDDGTPSPRPGDWYGIRLLDTQDTTSVSSIRHAEFRYASRAISPDVLSGDIVDNVFSGSDIADIYLEGDTSIKEGRGWDLRAPTRVVASNMPRTRDLTSLGFEDSSRTELLVHGALRTSSTSPAYWVEFASEVPDPARGEAWHGISVVGTGTDGDGQGVGRIRNALFDSARYPVSFFQADTAEVSDSQLWNYARTGITDFASDALIQGSSFVRGFLMDQDPDTGRVGRTGIHVRKSFPVIDDNDIFYHTDEGIWIEWGSRSACSYTPAPGNPVRTIQVTGNDIILDVAQPVTTSETGIRTSWVCGIADLLIANNNVQSWLEAGIFMDESSDVTMLRNCLVGNTVGVDHQRAYLAIDDAGQAGAPDWNGVNRLAQNNFDKSLVSNVRASIGGGSGGGCRVCGPPSSGGSPDAGLRVGQLGRAGTGQNRLRQAQRTVPAPPDSAVDGINYQIATNDSARMDYAALCEWWDYFGNLLTASGAIDSTNKKFSSRSQTIVTVSFVADSADTFVSVPKGCIATARPTFGGFAPLPVGGPAAAPAPGVDELLAEAEQQPDSQFPTEWDFSLPSPNPAREAVSFLFAVPLGNRSLRLDVYDVTGRRVVSLWDGPVAAGHHSISWDGTDESGSRVAQGVYFVRMETGLFAETRKVVVLR